MCSVIVWWMQHNLDCHPQQGPWPAVFWTQYGSLVCSWFCSNFPHSPDVCICYWNLCAPEEQFNHHLSDLQMKQYVALYWSAVSTLYSAHVHVVYIYALLPPSASPDRLWHVYAPSAEHIHHHTFVMPCQQ